MLPWEQCPCTLTNLRPESVSLPANSAMHKHCVYDKHCLWTTNSTVQEGSYEMNDSICFCVGDFHFANNQCPAVPTAARTRPCCDSVAAGRPNLHVEEAQNGTLGQAHENCNDFGPTRGPNINDHVRQRPRRLQPERA